MGSVVDRSMLQMKAGAIPLRYTVACIVIVLAGAPAAHRRPWPSATPTFRSSAGCSTQRSVCRPPSPLRWSSSTSQEQVVG